MKIVCMIPTYNNVDFIEEVIEHILSQGLDLVLLDDGSTDGTFEVCQKYSKYNNVELLQIKNREWEHTEIFRILYDMALLKSPDWVIRSDADELLESGINGVTLNDVIKKVDDEGFNIIQFDWFEFFLTDNDNNKSTKVKDRMKYYSWQYDFLYRAWKVYPGIMPELGWGHIPVFPKYLKYKIYPQKFVARHYRFRSVEQARQKITMIDSRTKDTISEQLGYFKHYKKILNNNSLITDHSILTRYNDDNIWNLERKFYPYIQEIPPIREDVFTTDGSLKMKINNISELRLLLKKEYEQWESNQKEIESLRKEIETYKKTSG